MKKDNKENNQTTQPTWESTIKNPVLQRQSTPLPPEAVDLLSLGAKFAVTPKEFPTMTVLAQTEKAALQIERNGDMETATNLRHDVTNILRKAKPPKSNLTSQHKKGLKFFKENEQVAVAPFDKGIGFVAETAKQ